MKTKRSIILISLSFLASLVFQIPTDVSAQEIEPVESVSITAEVVDIDPADQTLFLRYDDGAVFAMEVSQVARNFDQIEIGDMLKIDYNEYISLYFGESGQKPQTNEEFALSRSPEGEKPAGTIVETVDISAKVLAIDKKKRGVTLELADGKKRVTKVDPSIKAFDTLKVGDSIHIRHTNVVFISVENPDKGD